ncbi:MAG: hypothetical protein ACMXX9_00640 [Candidatus Woesearchaeota archaeon]
MEKDKELSELIDLFNKHFDKKIDLKKLKFKKINSSQENPFLNFVSNSRFSKFFMLKIIDKLDNYKFYLANKNIKLKHETAEEEYIEEEIGPGIIIREFEQEEIFDKVLDDLGFEVVNTTKNPYLDQVEWITKNNIQELNASHQDIIIALKEDSCIIFLENEVGYYNLDIKKDLEYIRIITKRFLDKKKNPTFIKHEEYITILLELLPGKVKLNQLT